MKLFIYMLHGAMDAVDIMTTASQDDKQPLECNQLSGSA